MRKFKKGDFVQNLAHRKRLVPLLERVKFDKPWAFEYEPKQGDDAWHPSGDCLPSPIELYEQATDPKPRDFPPSLLRTFMVGHFWHQYIQTMLVEEGLAAPDAIERTGQRVWAHDEDDGTPISYHWARGSGDVVPLKVPGFTGILDIKTMGPDDFKGMEQDGVLPFRFAKKYECQINIYMDFFDQDQGMFLGVDKATGRFAEVIFERNQPLIDTIYDKWKHVGECIAEGAPQHLYVDEDFHLSFIGPSA